ncbi:MAG: glycosyltransferase [Fibrobacter sp.]|nr:glycosyltransferase [Fibrobacter sp.]
MDNPLISVIVPIYKVEPYLRQCLDSIVNQTYTNLEIILVDDGSPDGCPAICDEYAVNDNRIIVIHKENGGLSDARNAGLDICKGEYISFVDSDDSIENIYFETLIKTALELNSDLVIGNNNTSTDKNSPLKIVSFFDSLTEEFGPNRLAFIASWGKLYHHSLFNEIRFPLGKTHEDTFTTYLLNYKAKKIVFINKTLYHYIRRTDSITGKGPTLDLLDACEQRFLFIQKLGDNRITHLMFIQLCWQCLDFYTTYKNMDNKKAIAAFKKYRQVLKYRELDLKLSIILKLFLLITAIHPYIYYLYKKYSPLKTSIKL